MRKRKAVQLEEDIKILLTTIQNCQKCALDDAQKIAEMAELLAQRDAGLCRLQDMLKSTIMKAISQRTKL
jgi:hypothetical protein